MQIHMCEPPGDILVFLTGEEEIEDACKKIAKECAQGGDSVGDSSLATPFLQTAARGDTSCELQNLQPVHSSVSC